MSRACGARWSRTAPGVAPASCSSPGSRAICCGWRPLRWTPPAFEQLAGRARRSLAVGAADAAASTLREALTLWRGEAFEEFQDAEFGAARARSLAELRLAALLGEAELALGRHRELAVRLEGLVRRHPFRERLWAQLMLALYRSGAGGRLCCSAQV
jgi:hypothetical protein